MTAQSTTSPSVSGIFCFRTFTAPKESTNSIRASLICVPVAELTVTDFSLPKKSLLVIWATRVTEPDFGQGLILCGCFRANAFTDPEARRSELPYRHQGCAPH